MSDQGYQTQAFRLQNKGVVARFVADALPPATYSNLNNLESRAENAISSRLGLSALSTDGTNNLPLGGPVYSISRMKGLDQPFRYAGAAGALYRRTGDSAGGFDQIANGLSGKRFSMFPYRPNNNASPYMFFADDNVLLKDNGALSVAQPWGGSPPVIPPTIQIGDPQKKIIENFSEGGTTGFTISNITGTALPVRFIFTYNSAIAAGIQKVTIPLADVASYQRVSGVATIALRTPGFVPTTSAGMQVAITGIPNATFNVSSAILTAGGFATLSYNNPGPDVGNTPLAAGTASMSILPSIEAGMIMQLGTDVIYVIQVLPDGFTANFTAALPFGGTFSAFLFQGSIAANTVGSIAKPLAIDLSEFSSGGTVSEDADFIQFALQIGSPVGIKEIKIFFDVGDGTFSQDYYWKSIVPSGYQPAVSGNITAGQAQTARVANRAAGGINLPAQGGKGTLVPSDLPDISQLQPFELKAGNNNWTTVQVRLDEFVPIGLAGQPANDWSKVVGWKIQFTTSPNQGSKIGIASFALIGGSGLDSFNGDPYDYRYTWFNINTGFETNPSITLSPQYFVNVRRQPIAVAFQQSNDSAFFSQNDNQFTHARLYRRGGTLTQAWYRIAEVPLTAFASVINGGVIFNTGNLQLTDPTLVLPVGFQIQVAGNTYGPLNGLHTIATSGPGFVTFALAVPNGAGTGGSLSIVQPPPITYEDSLDDATAELRDQLQIDNDAPVTSVLRTPINLTDVTFSTVNFPGGFVEAVTAASGQTTAGIVPGQRVTVGSLSNQESAYVLDVPSQFVFRLFLQNPHSDGESVTASTRPRLPMNLMAMAFDKAWLAGDPDNPHVLYYSKPFRPESFPPQNFIEVGTPDSPIMFMVATKGLLYVFTTKTVYQVLGAGSTVPVIIPTGVMHGAVSNFGWVVSEGVIYYQSYDGVYAFQGSSSPYLSAATEWVWTGKNLGPVPAMDTTQKAEVFMSYCNHEVYISYLDQNGQRHRQVYSDVYARWRSDDQATSDITAQFFEQDTGQFVVGKGDGMVYLDRINDYDSGGFNAGVEIKNPININLQTPQMDMGTLKAFKQYNNLMMDWDTGGQPITLTLLFDNGNTVMPLGTFSQNGRGQTQINVNNGLGQRSLNVALLITGAVTSVVTFNEISIGALVEAEFRRSDDSFWMKWGTDEFKLVKQGYFEYQSTQPVTYSVYIEGSSTARYTFTLPSTNGVRLAKRVRFPAVKAKLWRFVGTSTEDFQRYNESAVEVKGIRGEKGYVAQKLDQTSVA